MIEVCCLINLKQIINENNCGEIPTFLSTGMGDESMQFFFPMIHVINNDTLIFRDAVNKIESEDIVFKITSIDNQWNCAKEIGKISVEIFNDTIQSKGIYIIDFDQEKPFISLEYDDSQLIIFSDVQVYKEEEGKN